MEGSQEGISNFHSDNIFHEHKSNKIKDVSPSLRKRKGVNHNNNINNKFVHRQIKRSTQQQQQPSRDEVSDSFIVNSSSDSLPSSSSSFNSDSSRSDIIKMILRETPRTGESDLGSSRVDFDTGENNSNNNNSNNDWKSRKTYRDYDDPINSSSFSIENPSTGQDSRIDIKNSNNKDNLNDNQSDTSSNNNVNNQGKIASQFGSKSILTTDKEQNDDGVRLNVNPDQNQHQTSATKATGNMSVRCTCNLPSCVTNNYMCKSERRVSEDGKELAAGCFVQELDGQESLPSLSAPSSSSSSSSSQSPHGASVPVWNGRLSTARRGCVEMLREKEEMCSDSAGSPIHCCTQDMCNYPKSFYPSSVQHINNRLTFDTSSLSSGGIRGVGGAAGMTNLDHQVWLRAAVIAVPICGLMILVALIVVARRLLKSDEDYKDPDGRRIRGKFSHHPHYQPTHTNSNSSTHMIGGSSSSRSSSGIIGNHRSYLSSSHIVKPTYVDPSEYLLPPENNPTPCCALCHQPQTQLNSQHLQYPRSHNNSNNLNSETEELVQSNSNSGEGSPSQNCNCTMMDFQRLGHHLDGGGDGSGIIFSDSESFTSSVRPPSIFLGSSSSPELQHSRTSKKFDFLSKIGLSRSTTGDNNTTSPSQV